MRDIRKEIDDAVKLVSNHPVFVTMLTKVLEPYIVEMDRLHREQANIGEVRYAVASLITVMCTELALHFTVHGDVDGFEKTMVIFHDLVTVRIGIAIADVSERLRQEVVPPGLPLH